MISNEILIGETEWAGHLAAMASEAITGFYPVPARYRRGKYLLVFDPLDGSGDIDVNISVGTIFSVLRSPRPGAQVQAEDFLQPGTEQVCAGFALYGPSTVLVLTTGDGVDGFTLDRDIGAFVLTHPKLRIPAETSEFAINSSNERFWEPPVRRYVAECLAGRTGPRGKDFSMRWIASLVAEAFRILSRGGVFLYPADSNDPSQPGRLRLMHRGQSDRVHHRAGRRPGQHRPRAADGVTAGGPARAGAGDLRLPRRGGADRAVSPRPRRTEYR